MDKAALFGEVLEAAEGLPLEDQESLAEIPHRRVEERRREELVREVREAPSPLPMRPARVGVEQPPDPCVLAADCPQGIRVCMGFRVCPGPP
jgi:hypothetical protein